MSAKKPYNRNEIFERWFEQLKKLAKQDFDLKKRKRFFRNEWRRYFLDGMTAQEAIDNVTRPY